MRRGQDRGVPKVKKVAQGKEKKDIELVRENAYWHKVLHVRCCIATDEVRGEESWEQLKKVV